MLAALADNVKLILDLTANQRALGDLAVCVEMGFIFSVAFNAAFAPRTAAAARRLPMGRRSIVLFPSSDVTVASIDTVLLAYRYSYNYSSASETSAPYVIGHHPRAYSRSYHASDRVKG